MAEAGSNGRENQSDAARLLLAAARERFAVAATDLLLPDRARLTEWQRLTAAALLTRLSAASRTICAPASPSRFEGHAALHAALSSAHVPIALPILERAEVLRDADLGNVLVRRVEEHRFWKAHAPAPSGDELLFELVRDADEEIAAEAMELVIARCRRFDRFQEPAMGAGRAARRAPAQAGLDRRRGAAPLYRPAAQRRRGRRARSRRRRAR